VRSIFTALKGPLVGWGKLDRTATVKMPDRTKVSAEA